MTKNKDYIGRILIAVVFPLMAFRRYWDAFDGHYTNTQIIWGGVVTLALAFAIYLYFPVGKRVERGSLIWFLGLFTIMILMAFGSVMSLSEFIPIAQKAWGTYMFFFAIFIPAIHMITRGYGIPRQIGLFKGPAQWNKAES